MNFLAYLIACIQLYQQVDWEGVTEVNLELEVFSDIDDDDVDDLSEESALQRDYLSHCFRLPDAKHHKP